MGALEGQAAWCREGWEGGGAAELSLPCWPPVCLRKARCRSPQPMARPGYVQSTGVTQSQRMKAGTPPSASSMPGVFLTPSLG